MINTMFSVVLSQWLQTNDATVTLSHFPTSFPLSGSRSVTDHICMFVPNKTARSTSKYIALALNGLHIASQGRPNVVK